MSDQIDKLQNVMHKTEQIRNMSVIAHVDHGKSTLSDSLVVKAGLISKERAGTTRLTDTLEMEQKQGITIKSTGVSLLYEKEGREYLVNLIDSPGHIDFSSEVTAALRVTDGALVVVDCIDGVCVQTETVLRQACAERIKSVLMINKIDRAIVEKKLDGEEIYQLFVQTIDQVNVILSTYLPDCLGDTFIDAIKGNVAFGSGKECWAFRIIDFAKIYSKNNGIPVEKMCKYLWGDYFWDPTTKKFVQEDKDSSGKKLRRGFVEFVINPILDLFQKIDEKDLKSCIEKCAKLGVQLPNKSEEKEPKEFRKLLFSTWLDAADNILNMVIEHLPSPVEAMKYRTEQLYEGPLDDEIAQSIRNCDPNGPLVMYVSKMVPSKDFSKFFAFGRVFSGTLTGNQKVYILGSGYQYGSKEEFYETRTETPVLQMGKNFQSIQVVPAGNTIALTGMDKYIKKYGTITNVPDAYPIKNMKFQVSPVVQVAVSVKNPADLPKLNSGLQKLSKSDPLVQITLDSNTNQQIISGSGELHIEVCLTLLKQEFAKNIDILVSQPIVTYKETIVSEETQPKPLFTKSENKHNNLLGNSISLSEDFLQYTENNKINLESQLFRDKLVQEFSWDREHTKKIWAFAPSESNSNVLVDISKGVQDLDKIQDSIVLAFHEATNHAVYTGESLRGLRANLTDGKVHSDPAHRGVGQVAPMARRLFQAMQISSQPQIQEPIFLCEIQVPQEYKGNVYSLINKRRGKVLEEHQINNTPLVTLKTHLPVAESFQFTDKLREVTSGSALNQCVFDCWRTLPGSVSENNSLTYKVVQEIRLRKGLKSTLPDINDYLDKQQ